MVILKDTLAQIKEIKPLADLKKVAVKLGGRLPSREELLQAVRGIVTSKPKGAPRGRPKKEITKKRTDIRFDPDVLEGLKSHFGRGWSTRVNDEMRKILVRAKAL